MIRFRSGVLAVGAMSAAALAGPVTIQMIDPSTGVHSGWQVTVPDDTLVDVVTDGVFFKQDVVVIEKAAEFLSLAPVDLLFEQVKPDNETVSRIWITDEIITNSSGVAWPGFEMSLTGPAVFDPATSATFSIDPFTASAFGGGNTVFSVSGGVVADNSLWVPGMASGVLAIEVDLGDPNPVSFVLREQPVPSQGSVALLALGGVLALRRRR